MKPDNYIFDARGNLNIEKTNDNFDQIIIPEHFLVKAYKINPQDDVQRKNGNLVLKAEKGIISCPVKIYGNALIDCCFELYSVLCNRGLGIFTADTNNLICTFLQKSTHLKVLQKTKPLLKVVSGATVQLLGCSQKERLILLNSNNLKYNEELF